MGGAEGAYGARGHRAQRADRGHGGGCATCRRVAVTRATPPLAPASDTSVEGSWAKFKRARSVSLVANGGGAARGLRALETSVQVRQAQRRCVGLSAAVAAAARSTQRGIREHPAPSLPGAGVRTTKPRTRPFTHDAAGIFHGTNT